MNGPEPTAAALERATTALAVFVHPWRLPLNPEELEVLAYAALKAAGSSGRPEELDEWARSLLADASERAEQLRRSYGA